jgi:hypothetical protein
VFNTVIYAPSSLLTSLTSSLLLLGLLRHVTDIIKTLASFQNSSYASSSSFFARYFKFFGKASYRTSSCQTVLSNFFCSVFFFFVNFQFSRNFLLLLRSENDIFVCVHRRIKYYIIYTCVGLVTSDKVQYNGTYTIL